MKSNVHFFSQKDKIASKISDELLGIRGRQANEFAELGFPILPGFILDSRVASKLAEYQFLKHVIKNLSHASEIVGKSYGDEENPMLIKIVISSNLAITDYPTLHNFGLVKNTINGFAKGVGNTFAAHEVLFLVRGMLVIQSRLLELDPSQDIKACGEKQLKQLQKEIASDKPSKDGLGLMEEYAPYLPEGFFDSAEKQIELALIAISKLLSLDEQNDNDTAILIQPMVYGNYGKDSCSGWFYTRNVVSGEKVLQGEFYREKFNEIGASGLKIEKIGDSHLKELQRIGWTLEDRLKEIRQVRFTVENGKLWLIEQRSVDSKSTQADIKLLLDLASRKIVDEKHVISSIQPTRLNEILHRIIDNTSVKNLPTWKGGIAGAPGAAIGKVYFSTDALLEARKAARQKGEDSNFILVMPSTFAEDVKAIEVANGVFSCEGGYSAHASVVARQYGKVSLVSSELKIRGKKASLGELSIAEGDYITMNVPYYGESQIFLGKAALIEADPGNSGLLELIQMAKKYMNGFEVRANADSPQSAELALSFGADGIGLCRTEHMFFGDDRINIFREMVLAETAEDRSVALNKLLPFQKKDFMGILKTMAGKEVTIRLLDAPLHEFLPHNDEELQNFLKHLETSSGKKINKGEILAKIESMAEFNPMLGHRGCRIAVSYPEIYKMQIRAIFEAAYELKKEKIDAMPEIMIPIIMNANELKLIVYGKKIEGSSYKGVVEEEEAFRKDAQIRRRLDYSVGTMIELPAAALGASEIAKYGRFFSFGTNDLTQTTLGISRDDFTAFMPDYTLYDLIDGNPFSTLDPRVKELIGIAVERGRLTRPDLVCGLCGEHGANPDNIRFCIETGLNYVSCSSYSVPIAILAVAQIELEMAKN